MALPGHTPRTLVGANCPAHLPQHGPAFFHERLLLPGASLVVQLCVFTVWCLNVQSSDRSKQETLIFLFIYFLILPPSLLYFSLLFSPMSRLRTVNSLGLALLVTLH